MLTALSRTTILEAAGLSKVPEPAAQYKPLSCGAATVLTRLPLDACLRSWGNHLCAHRLMRIQLAGSLLRTMFSRSVSSAVQAEVSFPFSIAFAFVCDSAEA